MPASPGATIALTRPPAASVESKTLNPDAGDPSGPRSAGARSISSMPNRMSGLSDP